MEDPEFRQWLTRRSWQLCVRYCKVVVWLLPLAALAVDLPLLLSNDPGQQARLPWLVAWQAAVALSSLAVIATDRFLPRWGAREPVLHFYCAVFMVVVTWVGAASLLVGGTGIVIYAAGSTFLAAAICTAQPVRRPMYVLGLAVLGAAAWVRTGDAAATVVSLANLFCVVVLCLVLDRHQLAQALQLFREQRRAEAERARADTVLAHVLPPAVAEELKRTGRVQARKFDNLGVLFADIAGFTTFSRQLPPEALVLVLDEIFSGFDALVQRHGLEKIKTIGDAYMVVGDRRIPALCALALDMRAALDRYNRANGTALAMRIGLHAGPAVAGVLGVQRYVYDVWGDTVNVASRLESSGRAGCIQVSEPVVRQAGAAFGFSARGLVELAGRGPVLTWWLSQAAHPALAAQTPLAA